MTTEQIKEKWDEFRSQKGFLQRVDPSHPMNIFIGINEKGQDILVLFTSVEPALIRSSKSLDIEKNRRSDGIWALQIASVETQNQDIFAKLCLDLIESSQNAESEREGIDIITKRFLNWQKLFLSIRTTLPISVLKGLAGELLFAKEVLSSHYDWDTIVSSWLGPDDGDRDYVLYDKWFEIKSISTGKDTIEISSLDQLDIEGSGYIAQYYMDESSVTDNNAESIQSIVNDIREILSGYPSACIEFEQKLLSLGFIDKKEYEDIKFVHYGPFYYCVNERFPKLVPTNVPVQVVKANYSLSIPAIEKWKTGVQDIWK